MSDAHEPPATARFNKAAAVVAMSILDAVASLAYVATCIVLAWRARRFAHDADVHTVTLHDYSVRVQRLPPDTCADELTEFFGQYGEV